MEAHINYSKQCSQFLETVIPIEKVLSPSSPIPIDGAFFCLEPPPSFYHHSSIGLIPTSPSKHIIRLSHTHTGAMTPPFVSIVHWCHNFYVGRPD